MSQGFLYLYSQSKNFFVLFLYYLLFFLGLSFQSIEIYLSIRDKVLNPVCVVKMSIFKLVSQVVCARSFIHQLVNLKQTWLVPLHNIIRSSLEWREDLGVVFKTLIEISDIHLGRIVFIFCHTMRTVHIILMTRSLMSDLDLLESSVVKLLQFSLQNIILILHDSHLYFEMFLEISQFLLHSFNLFVLRNFEALLFL